MIFFLGGNDAEAGNGSSTSAVTNGAARPGKNEYRMNKE